MQIQFDNSNHDGKVPVTLKVVGLGDVMNYCAANSTFSKKGNSIFVFDFSTVTMNVKSSLHCTCKYCGHSLFAEKDTVKVPFLVKV